MGKTVDASVVEDLEQSITLKALDSTTMKLRDRPKSVKYVSDSEDDGTLKVSSSPETVVVVNRSRRKVQVSCSKSISTKATLDNVTVGAILRYAQPNVSNTNAINCSPQVIDSDFGDDDDFVEYPKSSASRRDRKTAHLPHSGTVEARKNAKRFSTKCYKEVSSSSDSSSRDDLDAKSPKFLQVSAGASQPSCKGKDELPNFSKFVFTKDTELPKDVIPGRRRLTKLASLTALSDTPKDANQRAVSQTFEDLEFNCNKETSRSRRVKNDYENEEDIEQARKSDALTVRKSKRESLRRTCAPKSLQEYESSEDDIIDSEGIELSSTKSKRSVERTMESSEAILSSDISEDIQNIRRAAQELEVDAFGLRTREGAQNPVMKRAVQVEKILAVKDRNSTSALYSIKERGKSYRSVAIVSEALLLKKCPQLLRNFWKRMDELQRLNGNPGEKEDGPAFNPLYIQVDRIVAEEQKGRRNYYLVKWCALPYSEATWELQQDLIGDKAAIDRFLSIQSKDSMVPAACGDLVFKDGRALRDYQEKGLAWMDHNFQRRVNCILADEMGLGKTMQSVAMIQNLIVKRKLRGPFLVVAPVSTLGHWRREVESLTDMNCIVYSGSSDDRDIIKQYELFYPKSRQTKFQVLLTSFEILMKDQTFLSKLEWRYVVIDEAHRLKRMESKTARSVKQLTVRKGGMLLLTGTPVQNNTKEIFGLLNLLDSEKFSSEEEFLSKYGDLKNGEQVRDLQENILKPRLLRRMKEDVEKSIPQKEETIIWVELTKEQRSYYRAILENRISDLLKGSQNSNLPNLRNVAMELRKICNHPFLCNGLQEDLNIKYKSRECKSLDGDDSQQMLCQASGKMLLLDKLLSMLKNAGHRVLIFSQFTIMLDLLEDYLISKNHTYERIDGTICGSDRQAAIDRYSAKDSNIFTFLLSTRAGGLGITLTAADTCIIYDSDWNPQNDLQAMARCHRIGQTKDVRIYRLITRNTYEQHLFECSSRKYGLDEAILGSMQRDTYDDEHLKNIESLLRKGAYDILKEDGEAEAAAFHAQNIEQILESRTQKRLIGGRSNNTFSVATFISNSEMDAVSDEQKPEVDGNSIQFWQELLPEACHEALNVDTQAQFSCGPRRRTKVNYREKLVGSDDDCSSDDYGNTGGKNLSTKRKPVQSLESEDHVKQWSEKEIKQLECHLMSLGTGRTEQIRTAARLQHHSLEEIQKITDVLIQFCHYFKAKNTILNSESTKHVNGVCPKPSIDSLASGSSGGNSSTSKICVQTMVQESTLEGAEMFQHNKDLETSVGKEPMGSIVDVTGKNMHLVTANCVAPTIPPFAQKAMCSKAFTTRLQKNAARYLQTIHEREVLSKAFSDAKLLPPHLSRSKGLPKWWGEAEDLDLMKGAHKHGHRDFHKIREDKTLCFPRFDACNCNVILGGQGPHLQDCQTESASAATNCIEKTNSDEQGQGGGWPHDSVLISRLKKLIKALTNDLDEKDEQKKIDKKAARKQARERRALKEIQESGISSKGKPGAPQGDFVRAEGDNLRKQFIVTHSKQTISPEPGHRGKVSSLSPGLAKEAVSTISILNLHCETLSYQGTTRPKSKDVPESSPRRNSLEKLEVANSSSESEDDTFQRYYLKRFVAHKIAKSYLSALSTVTEEGVPLAQSLSSSANDNGHISTSSTSSKNGMWLQQSREGNTLKRKKVGATSVPSDQQCKRHPFRPLGNEKGAAAMMKHGNPEPTGPVGFSTGNAESRQKTAHQWPVPLTIDKHAGSISQEKENDISKRKTSTVPSGASKKLKHCDADVGKQRTLLGFLAPKSILAPAKLIDCQEALVTIPTYYSPSEQEALTLF